MNSLEDVPFQTPLREEVPLVVAPDITIPDCSRVLRETEVISHTHSGQSHAASNTLRVKITAFTMWQVQSIPYNMFLNLMCISCELMQLKNFGSIRKD